MSDTIWNYMKEGDTHEITIPGVRVNCPRCSTSVTTFQRLDETLEQMDARALAALDGHKCVPSYSCVITGLDSLDKDLTVDVPSGTERK